MKEYILVFKVILCIDFCFCFLAFDVTYKKKLSRPMSKSFLPMFSSINFIIPGLMFKYLIDVKLIFVSGVRQEFSFVVNYVFILCSQHHLLK